MSTHTAALQELLDKQACQDLLARYACALEWVDEDALASVFWADAEIDYGFFAGRGDEFVPMMIASLQGFSRTWHNNGAPLLRITGDIAEAETHGTGATVSENDGQLVTALLGGRYFDRLERRNGTWRIAKRKYVVDWEHSFSVAADAAAPGLNRLDSVGSDHPLYRRL